MDYKLVTQKGIRRFAASGLSSHFPKAIKSASHSNPDVRYRCIGTSLPAVGQPVAPNTFVQLSASLCAFVKQPAHNFFLLPFSFFLLIFTFSSSFLSAQTSPYPPSPVIKEMVVDWSTHVSLAPGSDNWPLCWADDDNQYTAWGDGGGFGGTNSKGRSSIGVARIDGSWKKIKTVNIWGGHEGQQSHNFTGKSYGIIGIESVLYMWVGMFHTDRDQFDSVKLARSTDHGISWEFTEWAFTREEGLMMPTVCNYGKDYHGARDKYVYHYFIGFKSYTGPDDYEDKVDWLNCQVPGEIYLARVAKKKLFKKEAYEFYTGMKKNKAQWSEKIDEKKPVFKNPEGVGWCMNVSYNSGLKRYFLSTEHSETHRGNMAIFDAPDPWGPWTTVEYESSWGEGHIPVNTFYWNFSNKWTSGDGKEFSLIFTGRKENDSFNMLRGTFLLHR